jgi:membrane-bound serine protease (ClpP class)
MLFLQTTQKGYDVSVSGQRELIGKEGIALSFLRPSGIAEIDGKRVTVITEGEFIEKDVRIRVCELKDNQLVVHRVE